MGKPAAPPPAPDPVKTAEAQSASNVKTATTSQQLNMVDQTNPYGSSTYSQTGKWDDGTPKFANNVTFSPEQQNLYNLETQTQGNLGKIGVEQSQKVGDLLNTPFNINDATSSQLSDQATKLLDPVWKQRQQSAEADWLNRGIAPGMEAYSNMSRDFGDQRDRAYLTAALAGRGQATQEALTQRNQPLNEIAALLSGSQVSQPNFINTPNTTVAPTDVAGITQQGYQNSLVPWNANNQYKQALMGGLFGLGGAVGGGLSGAAFRKYG